MLANCELNELHIRRKKKIKYQIIIKIIFILIFNLQLYTLYMYPLFSKTECEKLVEDDIVEVGFQFNGALLCLCCHHIHHFCHIILC